MDNQDYLTEYRLFFDNFYKSFECDNPLPVHIGKYNVAEFEILGEVISWCLEYLNARDCPSSLIAPLCRSVINELEEVVRRDPESCGYRPKDDDYQTLKLMQVTIRTLNDVCLRYRDNSEVSRLPPPPPVSPSVSSAAVKNSRRTMEDSHIIIHDLHALFGIQGYGVASYYAVFDGHIGSDAALYSCSHIYQYLVESKYYPTNPEAAFREAFIKTDERFIDKSNKENLKSGTTAVCILIRHDLGKMYVAWIGDSQAILVNGRDYIQLVNPHRPEQLEEKERIEALGGAVVFWGTWRVNGQLAVSRAIGDVDYKPYVTAEPDVTVHDLTGDEDFLLLACDGLWDVVSEKHAVEEVYKCLELNKGDRSTVSQSLVQAAKSLGSKDNISVVVAWLDMSSLENGHFVPEMDAADDLLPPVLRSLKPAVQTITPPAPQKLDKSAEQWLKTLPWSYADALRKPAPKKDEPPPVPSRDPVPPPQPDKETVKPQEKEDSKVEEKPQDGDASSGENKIETTEAVPSPPKGDDTGDVGGEAESGDDSDEEWNYISGKENKPNQHTKRELTQEEKDEMESQLNPNAAEFVPTFGTKSPISDVDIADISHSPTKRSEIKDLDNIVIPSQKDFYNEICKRPSELDDFGENDTTVNGGDLTDISTKAVFGDDSVVLMSGIETSLLQNEPLKSSNPFASSHIPNFVQDHFSNENSKTDLESDILSESDKPDLFSPSAPVHEEISSSGQSDLTGIKLGAELNVDSIGRSNQDSPLLRESPEPSLYNGCLEQNETTNDLVSSTLLNKESDEVQPNEPEVSKEEFNSEACPKSPQPSNILHEDAVMHTVVAVVSEAVFHSDHGPETSVDSESEDDVLVSPKIKEREFLNEDLVTKEVSNIDQVCNLKPNHVNDNNTEEKVGLGIELEEEHVFHKDEEDVCSVKSAENPSSDFTEIHVESTHTPEVVTTDVSQLDEMPPTDFEINDKTEQNFDHEVCSIGSTEIKDAFDLSPQPEEEIISKEEFKENLVCPIKETPLLQETVKDVSEIEIDIVECNVNTQVNDSSHESVSALADDYHLKNGLESEKPVEEPFIFGNRETQIPNNDGTWQPSYGGIVDTKNNLDDLDDDFNYPVKIAICPCRRREVEEPIPYDEIEKSVAPSDIEENTLINSETNDGSVCPDKKDDVLSPLVDIDEDSGKIIHNGEEAISTIKEDQSSLLTEKNMNEECVLAFSNNADVNVKGKEDEFVLNDDHYGQFLLKDDIISTSDKENVSSPDLEDVSNVKLEEEYPYKEVESITVEKVVETLSGDPETFFDRSDEKLEFKGISEISNEASFEIQQNTSLDSEVAPLKSDTGHGSAEDSVITPDKTTESLLDNIEQSSDDKIHQEESIDEMSSSMIDHGEDKALPQPQTNQLDLVQDLQFDLNEKAEEKADADTESDSGFEIINASEASTIEIETRVQSEKEAGAIDEKLHLDKNEAEVLEKVESKIIDQLETIVESEVLEKKDLPPLDTTSKVEDAVLNGSVTPPATPPATPAPGLEVENKEGLIAAAVAAAGVATAVAAGTVAITSESKVAEQEKPEVAPPKKVEPASKTVATSKPTGTKPGAKPAASAKTPAAKAPPAPSSSKPTSKPSPAASKAAPTGLKSTASTKPATPAVTKTAPKPPTKPSTPPAAKPTGSSTSVAAKAKPASSAPPKPASSAPSKPATSAPAKAATAKTMAAPAKPAATTAKAAPGASRPPSAATAAKKPAPTTAAKPPVAATKTTVSSAAGRPTPKSTTTGSKTAVTSTVKSPSAPKPPSKPSTPTAPKGTPPAARPPSAKSTAPSKPPSSAAPIKSPAKPATAKTPAPKPAPTGVAAKSTTATKPAPGKTAAPAKSAPVPINKKPAAPTAIKKPAAPTEKSVKEANNKLASAKTTIKKVDEKKVLNKKEEIAENEVPLTQEPIVTTTNGHISLIENGIPSPEIVAEVN